MDGGLELWIAVPLPGVCAGCAFLSTIGPFPAGVGPHPPLHPFCRCRRERLDLSVVSSSARMSLAFWAERNRRAADEIERQALALSGRDAAGEFGGPAGVPPLRRR